MPAALPALTTISRVARMEVWAGAIRVSWVMGLPSAMSEIQVVSSARINRLRVVSGFTVAAGATAWVVVSLSGWDGLAMGLVAALAADATGDGFGDTGLAEGAGGAARVAGAEFVCGGEVAAEMGA